MYPLLLPAHDRQCRACGVDHTEEARVDHVAKLLRCHLLKWSKVSITGVVYQHVQPAIGVHSRLHRSLCIVFLANIEPYGLDALTVLLHQWGELPEPSRPRNYAISCGKRCLRDVAPQPVTASRNQPDLSHVPDLLCNSRFSNE